MIQELKRGTYFTDLRRLGDGGQGDFLGGNNLLDEFWRTNRSRKKWGRIFPGRENSMYRDLEVRTRGLQVVHYGYRAQIVRSVLIRTVAREISRSEVLYQGSWSCPQNTGIVLADFKKKVITALEIGLRLQWGELLDCYWVQIGGCFGIQEKGNRGLN